jgi:para-nitrobenzyl esterase
LQVSKGALSGGRMSGHIGPGLAAVFFTLFSPSIFAAPSPDITVYKAIRYAQPPTGNQRWKPPVPAPAPGSFESYATKDFAPACMQPGATLSTLYSDDPPNSSEDCLFLNIWKPTKADKAPVMVWIHGGALRTGNLASGLFDATQLARKGVIVVTLAYRLGVFGYLAHPELTAESAHHSSGNYGLLDQIAALHWVQDHIKQLGGDAGNITLCGESAGALSTIELMTSPLAQGLFQRAIVQSGYMVSNMELQRPSLGQPSAEAVGTYVANKLGAANIAALRAIDAHTLLTRSYAAGFDPTATIDGWVLPQQIVDAFDKGDQAHVPVIVGFNEGELRSLRTLLPPIPASAAEYESKVHALFGDLAGNYLEQYPSTQIEQSVLAASRDGLYGWTAERIAKRQTKVGVPTYLYFFEHQYPAEVPLQLEAFHASELPFEWGHVGANDRLPKNWPRPPDDATQRAVSAAIMSYFTNFARNGKPSAHGEPDWQPYSAGESYLDIRDKPRVSKNLLPGMYDLHEEIVSRRHASNRENWYVNVGLASPVLPARPAK